MNNKAMPNLVIPSAYMFWKNFSGKERGKFNAAGNRNFCVRIDDPAQAQQMANEGWNVRVLPPRDPGDEPCYYISVNVRFDGTPPKIILITSRGKTTIGEDEVNIIDWAEIANADLIIRPYPWKNQAGMSGIKGYLKTAYITIREDEFEAKYNDLPDAPATPKNVINDDDMPF